MQDPKYLQLISLRLSGSETELEKRELDIWLDQNPGNFLTFTNIKHSWEENTAESLNIKNRFNKKYILKGLLQETLGSLVGFAIGFFISTSFTHYVREKRTVKNLFGVLGRKQVVINLIPEWMQFCLSVILGFIALEIIKYFVQSKNQIGIFRLLSRLF